jgi:hypothetical protein
MAVGYLRQPSYRTRLPRARIGLTCLCGIRRGERPYKSAQVQRMADDEVRVALTAAAMTRWLPRRGLRRASWSTEYHRLAASEWDRGLGDGAHGFSYA